ncbi:MAG: nucleoside monophosphate kinase [Candidatus Glassbacteria bacterium]|nr:nucleoside monophosphate kinase [Candidatus Glassbacteria bacterium]
MDKYKAFLIFGPNGIGKGTNAKAVGTLPGYFHFSTGDMFRALVARVKEGTASELELQIDEIMKSGRLVDDETTVRLTRHNLETAVAGGRIDQENDYLLLDGVPRNVEQARMLDPFIEVCGVLHITAAREVAVERITNRARIEGRKDDQDPVAVGKRLDIFFANLSPMLSYYDSGFDGSPDYDSQVIHYIDAAQRPTKVLLDVLACLP